MAIWPFGKKIVATRSSEGCLSLAFNIIWILVGGIWIALTHLLFGILFFITIVGIPFAKQHLKLAGLALTPFGHEIRNE